MLARQTPTNPDPKSNCSAEDEVGCSFAGGKTDMLRPPHADGSVASSADADQA